MYQDCNQEESKPERRKKRIDVIKLKRHKEKDNIQETTEKTDTKKETYVQDYNHENSKPERKKRRIYVNKLKR